MSTVRISSTSQAVSVTAEDRADVVVRGPARVIVDGDRTTIDEVAGRLDVRIPVDSDVVIGTVSARIQVRGPTARVAATTESGRIDIEEAAEVDARTSSARVTVGRVSGSCRARSQSGRVEIGVCGSADVATVSGRITVAQASGPVVAHCVSGRIDVTMDVAADVEAETVSGRVKVTLPREVEPGVDCACDVRSVTGRVEIARP